MAAAASLEPSATATASSASLEPSATATASSASLEPAEMLMKAIEGVLGDDGFRVPSTRASEALECAKKLQVWGKLNINIGQLNTFSGWLINSLKACLQVTRRSMHLRVEKVWEQYHALRTSDNFSKEWNKFFMLSLEQKALPTLYQYMTHRIFRKMMEIEFSVQTGIPEEENEVENSINTVAPERRPAPLTLEEENVLRYVTGYVCRKVQKSIEKSSRRNKDDLILFMFDLAGDETDTRGTEEWTNAIDRGGLWHVNDNTYVAFLLIEEEIRRYLNVGSLKDFNETTKKHIIEAIMKNEELLFQWTFVSVDADDSVAMEVLKMISTLYLTVRGFAFANACMELYKQRNKKQVQKSKALRKKIATGDSKAA